MSRSPSHPVPHRVPPRPWVRRAIVGTLMACMTGLSLASIVWNPFPVNNERLGAAASGAGPETRPTSGPASRPTRSASGKLADPSSRPTSRSKSTANGRPPAKTPIQVLSQDGNGRVVQHAAGTTRVPLQPQRIIALNWTDELIALGVKPYAIVSGRSYALVPDYLSSSLVGCQEVPAGHLYDPLPSYDYLAGFEPDLILTQVTDIQTYNQYSALAPTVVLRTSSTTENKDLSALKRRLFDLGKVLGKESEASAAIESFDEKLEKARKELSPVLGGKTVACFRCRWQRWTLFGAEETGGTGPEAIFDALGIKLPASGAALNRALDLEDLMDIDPDYIIVAADDTVGAPQELRRLQQSPLWRRFSAVRGGRVLEIKACNQWIDSGLLGKSQIIDDLYAVARLGAEKGGHGAKEH